MRQNSKIYKIIFIHFLFVIMLLLNLFVSGQALSDGSIKASPKKTEKFILDSMYLRYEYYKKKEFYDSAFDVSLIIYNFYKTSENDLNENVRRTSLYTLGEAYYNIDSFKKAQTYLEKLTTRIRTAGLANGVSYLSSLSLLSKIYSAQGNHKKTISLLLEALPIAKKTRSDNIDEYHILKNLAEEYASAGSNEKSIKYYKRSIDKLLSYPQLDSAEYSYILTELGEAYRIIDEDTLALKCFEKSSSISSRVLNLKINSVYRNMICLSYTYHDLYDCKKADSCYLSLFSFAEKYNMNSGADFFQNKIFHAKILAYCGDRNESIKILSHVSLNARNFKEADTALMYDIYLDLGDAFYSLNFSDSALAYYQYAANYLSKNSEIDSVKYSNLFKQIGLSFESKNEYDSAIFYYKKCIEYTSITNQDYKNLVAYNYRRIGICFSFLLNYTSAEQFFLRAKKNIESANSKDWETYSDLISDLSGVYWGMNDTSKVFSILTNFYFNINKINPKPFLPLDKVVFLFYHYYSLTSQWNKAENVLIKHKIYISNTFGENSNEYRQCLSQLRDLYRNTGNIKKSKIYKNEYTENLEKFNIKSGSGSNEKIRLLAEHYHDIGDNEKAVKEYRKLINIFKETEGEFSENYLYNLAWLADLFLEINLFDSAHSAYRELLTKYKMKSGEINFEYPSTLNGLAVTKWYLGDLDSSEAFYNESLRIQKKLPRKDEYLYALTLTNLGVLLVDKNKFIEAENAYRESADLYLKITGISNDQYIWALNNLAYLYLKTNQIYKGLITLKDMLKAQKERLNNSLSTLTENERQSFWAIEKTNVDNILNYSISFTLNSGIDSAALSEFSDLAYNSILISKSLLLNAATDMEMMLKTNTDSTISSIYNNYINIRKTLISKNDHLYQNEIQETEKIRLKLDSLQNILLYKLSHKSDSDNKLTKDLTEIKKHLSVNEVAIEFIRFNPGDSIAESPLYFALVLSPKNKYPSIIKIGNETEIRAAIQSKNFSHLYRLVWKDIDTLLSAVQTVYYSPVGELNNVAFSALCFESGDSLYAYQQSINRGVKIEDVAGNKQSCGSYLIDKYTLHQLTTTRYLADSSLIKVEPLSLSMDLYGGVNYDSIPAKTFLPKKAPTNKDYALELIITDTKRTSRSGSLDKMPYLEGTRTEVSSIDSIFIHSKWKVRTFTNKDAGEFEFKKLLSKASPGILHIATHGFAFQNEIKKELNSLRDSKNYYKLSEDPMVRCGLMLSGSNISWTGNPKKMIEETGEDGILTAAEVANMDLSNTKLVVLSACETGLGKIEGSEGTFGLKRGFKLAGVEQLIVSLWSVPDKETMELMTLFYKDLAKTLNPVISFDKALKVMRNKYPTEPEKWAGFVLVR